MEEIGNDVKIVGEKLLEHCELTAELVMTGNFWYRAVMTVRENTHGMFLPHEVRYMNDKWREAERKYFGSLVVETVATGDMSQNSFKLPPLLSEVADQQERDAYERTKAIAKQEIKDKFDLDKYEADLRMKVRVDETYQYNPVMQVGKYR